MPPEINPVGNSPENRKLEVCLNCQTDFVHPVTWEEVTKPNEQPQWKTLLRCGNCGSEEEGVFSQKQIDIFDEALDRQMDSMIRLAKKATRENMEEETRVWADALQNDHILPMDF